MRHQQQQRYRGTYTTKGITSYLEDIYCYSETRRSANEEHGGYAAHPDYYQQQQTPPPSMKLHPDFQENLNAREARRAPNLTPRRQDRNSENIQINEVRDAGAYNKSALSSILELKKRIKDYEKRLIDALELIQHHESILKRLSSLLNLNHDDYDLIPVSITRLLSKIHYTNYIKNSESYQKLKKDMLSMELIANKALDKYTERDKNIESLRHFLGKIIKSFNSADFNITESTVTTTEDLNSFEQSRTVSSSDRITNISQGLVTKETYGSELPSSRQKPKTQFKGRLEKGEAGRGVGSGREQTAAEVDMINIANFTNELNLMALEEFNELANTMDFLSAEEDYGGQRSGRLTGVGAEDADNDSNLNLAGNGGSGAANNHFGATGGDGTDGGDGSKKGLTGFGYVEVVEEIESKLGRIETLLGGLELDHEEIDLLGGDH